MRRASAAAALVALAACSNDPGREPGIGPLLISALPVVGQSVELPDNRLIAGDFSPEAMGARPQDYRIIGAAKIGQPELAARVPSGAGGVETFVLQSGATASFRDGVLVATRGLGDDLIAADAPGLRAALRAGGGTVERVHESLDSLDRIVTERFACTVSRAGPEEVTLGLRTVTAQKVTESCANDAVQFENLYWLDSAGGILSSRQFVTLTVAYLRSNLI